MSNGYISGTRVEMMDGERFTSQVHRRDYGPAAPSTPKVFLIAGEEAFYLDEKRANFQNMAGRFVDRASLCKMCEDDEDRRLLTAWIERCDRGELRISMEIPETVVVTGYFYARPGETPMYACAGQRWRIDGREAVITEVFEGPHTSRAALQFPNGIASAMDLGELTVKGHFLGGPQTGEEELVWIAEQEMLDVPEFVAPQRWACIVAACKESAARGGNQLHELTTAAALKQAIGICRSVAPLFLRPM